MTTATVARLLEEDEELLAELRTRQRKRIEKGRAENAKAIEKLEREKAKVLPGLVEKREKAEAAVQTVQDALEAAKAEANAAYLELQGTTHSLDAGIRDHQRELERTADPQIDAFIVELDGLAKKTRKRSIETRQEGKIFFGGGSEKLFSTRPAMQRRLEAIRDAIGEAERLKLEVGADVEARIGEIRDAIPKGDALERVR